MTKRPSTGEPDESTTGTTMDDDTFDITEQERAAAAELARALEEPSRARAGSDAAFALALKASHASFVPQIDPAIEEQALERALEAAAQQKQRRLFGPLLLAAAVLLLAVPAVGTLNQLASAPRGTPTSETEALPTADALLGGPIDADQGAGDRTAALARARTRSYFDSRIARERGAR